MVGAEEEEVVEEVDGMVTMGTVLLLLLLVVVVVVVVQVSGMEDKMRGLHGNNIELETQLQLEPRAQRRVDVLVMMTVVSRGPRMTMIGFEALSS